MGDLRVKPLVPSSSCSSCTALAIAERKVQRPGGCVGIFFKLFDWNRRFAKKKLFPKKLLPPARTKQVSKKFNADEKLPMAKHLLIADENSGGFPSMKKKKNANYDRKVDSEQKQDMISPGLVARLMGLEALPVSRPESPDHGSVYSISNGKGGKPVSKYNNFSKEDHPVPDKGNVRQELRPQKIQKTGLCERHPVTRFGAEAFQIKNVLSKSRKRQPKLLSPVKSPRMSRNTARLIDAAARILEPGLQASSRARSALTYSNAMAWPLDQDEVMREANRVIDLPAQFSGDLRTSQYLRGLDPCRNCGQLLESMELRSAMREQPPRFDLVDSGCRGGSFQRLETSKSKGSVCMGKESEVVLLKARKQPNEHVVAQARVILPPQGVNVRDRVCVTQVAEDQCHFPSRQCVPETDALTSSVSKYRALKNNQILVGGDRVPSRSRLTNTHGRRVSSAVNNANECKDFISLNKNLSQSRIRFPSKLDNRFGDERQHCTTRDVRQRCTMRDERQCCTMRDESISTQRNLARRRRTSNLGRIANNSGSSSFLMDKERSARGNAPSGSRQRFAGPVNRTFINSRPATQDVNGVGESMDVDVVSFSFNSPLKPTIGTCSSSDMDEEKRDQTDFVNCKPTIGTCSSSDMDEDKRDQADFVNFNVPEKTLEMEKNVEKKPQNSLLKDRDALSVLLELKLKELTFQAEDESATGLLPSGRTTASILQELISALTADRQIGQETGIAAPTERDIDLPGDLAVDETSKEKSRPKISALRLSSEGNHFSPGSVLEASFSNESCISSSVDDSSGHMLHYDSMDLSYDQPQSCWSDADLSDSACSVTKPNISSGAEVNHLVNRISKLLGSLNLPRDSLSGMRLDNVKEVIFSSELLFGNGNLHCSEKFVDFLLGPFLNKLESLALDAWKDTVILGLEATKEEDPLKRFIFDCLIECLDIRYHRRCNLGYDAWNRLPEQMDTEMLVQVFDEDVRKWASVAGRGLDEIVEWEMSTSSGKWTDLDIEAFEAGAEVGQDIVQNIIDEIVVDLCGLEHYQLGNFVQIGSMDANYCFDML